MIRNLRVVYQLKRKYKFVYDEDCCATADQQDLIPCALCGRDVCSKCAVVLDGSSLHRDCPAAMRYDLELLKLFRAKNLELQGTPELQYLEIKVSDVRGYEQKPACVVEISASTFLANLCMWSSGECECEVMDSVNSDRLFWKYRVLNTENELDGYLKDIYAVLGEIYNSAG